MDMSQINKCSMESCAYNSNRLCRTLAITVGPHAECNTYVHASSKSGFEEVNGGIGACQTADCRFNERLECRAPNIDVSDHGKHADCQTFQAK